MAVTIQKIADLAGVSRGTVDRALNGRGRVNADVAARILSIANELDYIPKSKRKKTPGDERLKIGIITQLAQSPFMIEIYKGIRQAVEELSIWGIEVVERSSDSVDEKEQLSAMDSLAEEGIHGLAIMPVNSNAVCKKINWLIEEKGIPVVTFNSDIVGTKRLCFVGMDNHRSGFTAAGLMHMMTRGTGKILIITGFLSNQVNSRRVDGFLEELKHSGSNLAIAAIQGSLDEADEVEKIIKDALHNIPDITGILVVSSGQEGIMHAFNSLELKKRPYVIIYDQTPANEQMLCDDIVDFLIEQDGYLQGYRPAYILANLLKKGQPPESEYCFTDIRIKTKYNL